MTSRTAIVTGAARGIGAETARRLARDGLSVAVTDLRQDECDAVAQAIVSAGGTAFPLTLDVTDEAAVKESVATIADVLGPPTILVNNAGITRDNLLFKMSTDDWDQVMDVHLRGAFFMTRTVQSHMTQQSWGRIVNISSLSALGNRGQANYSAAKAGLIGFTKTLAMELGKFGITVNVIGPGFIETDMTIATAERMRMSWEELKDRWVAEIPVNRVGLPEDIAHAVSFFASEDAGFVSGQVLYVAGGYVSS